MEPRQTYHDLVRRDVFPLLPDKLGTVLDFGGGIGATAAALRHERAAERTVLFDQVAEGADDGIDDALAVNLDEPEEIARALAETGPFDTVLCLDILEHLRDPWQTLAAITKAMAPGASMIISLPNVRNWSVVGPLLFGGRFEYVDAGILDRTHLRWFTRRSAAALATSSGLELRAIEANIFGRGKRLANTASLGLFEGFLASQYKLVVRKPG